MRCILLKNFNTQTFNKNHCKGGVSLLILVNSYLLIISYIMINNEVTLSRKNCKINTSQPPFRGLVVDEEFASLMVERRKEITASIL
jgi:hypothetical protein